MKSLSKDKIFWSINVLVLFFYAVDIFGFPNKLAIIWIALFGLYCWKNKMNITLDIKAILLTIAMFSHAAIYKYYTPGFSITLTLSLGVVPVLFYLLGRQLIGNFSKDVNFEERAELVTFVIAAGMFIHALLNHYAWLQGHDGKIWNDFWPDGLCVATTTHGFLAVAAGALIAYGIYYAARKWYVSIVVFMMALIVNVIHIIYDSRMVLVITVLILGMNLVIYLYLNRKSKKAWYTAIGAVIIPMLVIAIALWLNLGGIRDSRYLHNLITRDGGIVKNIRFQIQAKAITQLLSHWKGGATMELLRFGSAHNYWLDLANHTGLASFIPMVLFTVSALKDMVMLILNKEVSDKLKYLLPSVFMSVFLYHCIEPGGIPRPDYILYLTLMAGIVYQTQKCAMDKAQNN